MSFQSEPEVARIITLPTEYSTANATVLYSPRGSFLHVFFSREADDNHFALYTHTHSLHTHTYTQSLKPNSIQL